MTDDGGQRTTLGRHNSAPSPDLGHPSSDVRHLSSDLSGQPSPPSVSPLFAGLMCRCPGCGRGKLFRGFLGLPAHCDVCGLDYGFIDAGDGPAVFVILLSGFIVVGGAVIVEALYQPPFWLHAALWGPLILLTTLGPLRPMKGLLIALQYHHKAAEGRLERRPGA
jgi:uncharacterized protein (DUF983 family)